MREIVAARGGKTLIALWLLALSVFVAIPAFGLIQGEFLGSLAYSVFPSAILLNISVGISCFVRRGSERIAKAAWIGLSSFALLLTLYAFDGRADSDVGMFLVPSMLVLSFPGGLLVPLVHAVLYGGLSITFETSYLSLVLDWLGFLVLGYLQWFKLLPYIINRSRWHSL